MLGPADLARLAEPDLALRPLRGLVVLDEIQHKPEIFRLLRVLADRDPSPARFLVLGSASPDLLQQTSESLACRIGYHELTGLRLFAHWHGQLWNASELGRSFGVADPTVRRYLDLLTSRFVVRQLQPWHEEPAQAPGEVAQGVHRRLRYPACPSGLARPRSRREPSEAWRLLGGLCAGERRFPAGRPSEEAHFWATHQGAELDLLIVRGSKRRGFEFKRTTMPIATRSMRFAIKSLGLEHVDVIHAGADVFPLAHDIRAVPLTRIEYELEKL